MLKAKNKIFIHSVLITIILFHGIMNYLWILNDSSLYIGEDVIAHMNFQVDLFYKLKSYFSEGHLKHILFLLRPSLPSIGGQWPRLVWFISAIMNLIFGNTKVVTLMSNIIYLIVLIYAVYFISKFYGSTSNGLLASFIVSFYPHIFAISRKYGLDFPLTAFVALGICFLLYSDYFQNKTYSILFGITSGIGFLIKPPYILFLIGPLLYCLFKSFFEKELYKNKEVIFNKIINLSLAGTIAIIISSVWWYGQLRAFWREFLWNMSNNPWMSGYVTKLGIFSYPIMYRDGLGLFFLFVFFISLASLFFYKIKDKAILFLWLIVPLVIFSALTTKEARYFLPTYPAFAIITAIGILKLNIKLIKTMLISIALLLGTFNIIFLSYFKELKDSDKYLAWSFERTILPVYKPIKNNWEIIMDRFIQKISKENTFNSIDIAIVYLDIHPGGKNFNKKINTLRYFLTLNRPDINIYTFTHYSERINFINNKDRFNYLIAISPKKEIDFKNSKVKLLLDYPDVVSGMNLEQIINDIVSSFSGRFKIIDSANLSGEDFLIFLYKLI